MPNDPASVFTLQRAFGYFLTPDTRQQKAMLLVGPKRSGKGTIGRVLTALLGRTNITGPTLASMASNFGLAPLLGKLVAIISDARLSGRTDQAAVVERILSITGEDTITIDRKHREPVTCKLPTRFLLLTNELPRLNDASGAFASRFIVLMLERSFYEIEDHGLFDRLIPELPSILKWAIEGWNDLHERGRFEQPESGADAIRELEELGSPVGAFVRQRCIVGPAQAVASADLFEAWKVWCGEHGRDRPGNTQTFGRDLRAVVPALRTSRPRSDEGRHRTYEGVDLML